MNGINKLLSRKLREHKSNIIPCISWMIQNSNWKIIYDNILSCIKQQHKTPTNINKQIDYNISNNIVMNICTDMNLFIINYDNNIVLEQENCDLALLIINLEYFDKLRELTLKNYQQKDYQCEELVNLSKHASKVFDANCQTGKLYVLYLYIYI